METKLTRRNFLKGAAAGSMGVAALGILGGCAPTSSQAKDTGDGADAAAPAKAESSWKTPPTPVDASEIAATYEADVVVVGHGHAGLCATREIAEEGTSVICIDRQEEENYLPNGNEGGVINVTYLQEKQGVPAVDPIDFFNNWQVITGNTSNPALVMKYCQNSGANTDWYLDRLSEEELDTAFIAFRN